jgi:hypothetical protein
MCTQCNEIEIRIEQYRRLIDPALDEFTLLLMREAVASLEVEKSEIKCDAKAPGERVAKNVSSSAVPI